MLKPITYYKVKQGLYQIDENGNIWSNSSSKFMKTRLDKDGYVSLSLKNSDDRYSNFYIHRLMMTTFYPVEGMENLQVNHKDGNKLNNTFENLEQVTNQENLKHALDTGLRKIVGEEHPRCKITEKEAKQIIQMIKDGVRPCDIVRQIPNANKNIVNLIKLNKTWRHLPR